MVAAVETMAYNKANGIPWHGLGEALDGAASAEEMLVAAGLDWEVVKQPILHNAVGSNSIVAAAVNKVVTVRSSDSRALGIVGSGYQPIQNRELFDFAEALTKTGPAVLFETAGSLHDGKVTWALASVPDQAIRVDGDDSAIMPYLVLNTGHDGLRAFMASFTPVRVVCANTLNAALSGSNNIYKIRHTVNALDKVAEARKALGVNVAYLEASRVAFNAMQKRKLTLKDVMAFTVELIPSQAQDEERMARTQDQRDGIVALYQNSDNLQNLPLSAYRLFQATAEWVDHDKVFRGTKKGDAEEARALALLDGTGQDIKSRALRLLTPAAAPRGPRGQFVKA